MEKINNYIKLSILCFTLAACQSAITDSKEPVLARVYNKSLYLSDLDKIISKPTENNDSITKANAFIERWIRDNLVLYEAEKSWSTDPGVSHLVEDYRKSLILYHYEKNLLETQLDTSVSNESIQFYYAEKGDELLQAEPLIRARFVKLAENSPGIKEFEDSWKKNNTEKINDFCQKFAEIALLDTTVWYKISEITQQIPPEGLQSKSWRKGSDFRYNKSGFKYFLKLDDFKDKNEIPPLAYVKDQIIKIILHRREKEILQNFENQLLEKATNNNNVQIYIQ